MMAPPLKVQVPLLQLVCTMILLVLSHKKGVEKVCEYQPEVPGGMASAALLYTRVEPPRVSKLVVSASAVVVPISMVKSVSCAGKVEPSVEISKAIERRLPAEIPAACNSDARISIWCRVPPYQLL